MIISDLIRASCLLVLAALTLSGNASILALAITGFVLTSGRSFHSAATQAMIPHITGRDRAALASANSRIATTESVADGFVGPPIGSALFAITPWMPFAADAVSFGASAVLLRAVPTPVHPEHNGEGIFASLSSATKWMFRQRQLVELALLIAGGNLATNAALVTFVLFAQDRLGVGAIGFGLLLAAQAVGAVIGGWAATRMSRRISFRRMLPVGQAARALAFITLAFASSPYIAAICMAIIGASFTIATVAAVSLRQQLVPDQMLGRVVNVFRLIGNGAAPIGAAIGGVIAANFAIDTPIIAGGIFTLGIAALSLLPHFRTIPEQEHSR